MIIFVNFIFLLFGFSLILKSQKRYLSYVNHLNIFGFVWAFITVGTQFAYPKSISLEITVFYYIAWLFYIIGSSILVHKCYDEFYADKIVYRRIKILIVLLLIFCLISNWELLSLILNTGNLLAWAALRKENGFEDLESNIFYTLFQRSYLIYIPLAIFLYKNKKITLFFLILIIITGVIYSVLRFTRAPILNLLIILIVSYVYIYNKSLPILSIILSVVLLFLVFGGSMMILSQGTRAYNVFDDIKLYLFGGQVVYQDILEGKYLDNTRYDINYFSFDFLNYILKKIGVIESYPSYVREYSTRSLLLTNTYTYLDAFTYDFGISGAFLGSFILGLFSDYAYRIYIRRKNIFALVFYGFICYFSCFVFANNEFIRFPVLLTAVSLIIYHLIVKRKNYVL